MDISIKPLEEKYISIVPTLIKAEMSSDIFPLTIYSSRGYKDYLLNIVKVPPRHRKIKFYGAFVEGNLVGYSEWRLFKEQLFLNNIYVFSKYQGFGIGKFLLMNHGKDLMKKHNKSSIVLDVFDCNLKALLWYGKLGFKEVDSTYWYLGEQQPVNTQLDSNDECYIDNYTSAEAEQKYYDFSMLTCTTRKEIYHIGRIRDQYYRVTNPNLLNDQELLHCLFLLDPSRQFLLLTNEKMESSFRQQLISKRMKLSGEDMNGLYNL